MAITRGFAECKMGAQRGLQFSSSLKELIGFETATVRSSTQLCSASAFRVLNGSIRRTFLQLDIKHAKFRAIDSRELSEIHGHRYPCERGIAK